RTTVDRLDGLGHTVRINLMRIVTDTHPELVNRPRPTVDPWQDDSVIYCTQKGFDKRKEEIDYLTKVKIPENARAIGEAAARGDLSENSEYKFALEERDLLQARLMKMQQELSLARLISPGDVSTEQVGLGVKVSLAATDGSDRREFTILGPFESDMDQAIYNYRAPLCARLRGLRAGDTVRLDLGSGEREYRIENIANALTP
ncbi:MAG TPA: GreA/GreB family elongation factor, partial [Phycisphaerae bacterium]|nr:GreA/GreB family elongation factor [Phycisphaerae bacterium]